MDTTQRTTHTETRTVDDIRRAILDLMPDLQRQRDVMPHAKPRLGMPFPVDPASLRYQAASRALDHLQEAVNGLGIAIQEDDEDSDTP